MPWVDIALVVFILSCLLLLGGSRLVACISTVALQGVLLGFVPLALHGVTVFSGVALAALTVAVKALLLPWFLRRAIREASILREVQPIVSLNLSLLFGLGALAFSGWAAARLPLPPGAPSLGAPTALFMVLVGLFLVVARSKALTQVIGFLVVENGIFLFGALFAHDTPWLVEIAVLLDVLVGVFVMGIALFHINRAFDSIDSRRLHELHDLVLDAPSANEGTP